MPASKAKDALVLNGTELSLEAFLSVTRGGRRVSLDAAALERVVQARECVERRLRAGVVAYGINTGFGALADVTIPSDKLSQLQLNLIRSHACGVGEPLAKDVVRGMLVLRIQTILRGNSGARPVLVELMRDFLNHDIIPIVPRQGSVGACGDLAPLAHLALALIGEGEVIHAGAHKSAAAALEAHGLRALKPEAKEGLVLINGTQVMTSAGLHACADLHQLIRSADLAASVSLDALSGTLTAFRAEIHEVRPHRGQSVSARNVRNLLVEDGIRNAHASCGRVQDAYSLRCVPQVHGAVRDTLSHAQSVLLVEANSSTDNPLVFPETDEILSGGNFHGEPVAMVLDFLAIAAAEIASISERRIEKLTNPHTSGLPPFLSPDSGLNSGYMIPHVVAAALVSENKVLCHPASVDSIPTSAEKEDHVSMGMTAALKLGKVLENVGRVLAIELLAGCDGLEFHAPMTGGKGPRAAHKAVRTKVPRLVEDRSQAGDIAWMATQISSGAFMQAVEGELGFALE